MRLKPIAIAGLAGALAVCVSADVAAQFGGGFPGGGMRGNRNRTDGAAREQRPPVQDNSPEQIEDRLGMLEEDLRLSAEQRNAWQNYANKVQALVADLGRERQRGTLGDAQSNTVQQIDRAVDAARNRLTALEDIAAAARALYGSLTAQQKTIADARMATIVTAIINPGSGAGAERPGRQRP